jgi:valyl-tRNA synthetase
MKYVVVATTRPETMLGDTAVAINPKDKRYKHLLGKRVILPIVNRELKIIADMMVDPKFGTGVVKVTPAHDPNDFQIAKRHKLDFVTVINPDGSMNENAGEYQGMDRFECRQALITELRERNLLVDLKPHTHAVSHCYRCHTVIEPYLSRQWFVRMRPLAEPAIRVVSKGKVKFYPFRWKKVYLNWMENIQDWCISRQIWWGHRIPVYYCKKCQGETGVQKSKIPALPAGRKNQKSKVERGIIVSKEKPVKCPHCDSRDIYQDPDVLDTWFSSWLWPFATFGWPFTTHNSQLTSHKAKSKNIQSKSDLDYFYPTSVLVTAPEILFFWVARMIMAGIEFIGNIPFRDVYIHGTVRDTKGLKMSKSLGNIIDPIDIINEFGCDALRFSIIYLASSSQDIFLSKEKFELGRNFANKIWNASRFALMYLKSPNSAQSLIPKDRPPEQASNLSLADKWILSRLNRTVDKVTKALERFRFNDASNSLYEFFWHEFCDWYLELIKPILTTSNPESEATKAVLFHVLETSLRLLHPFMPFITEEIWQHLKQEAVLCPEPLLTESLHSGVSCFPIVQDRGEKNLKNKSIMVTQWPRFDRKKIDKVTEEKLKFVIAIISAIRNVRSEMSIPHSKKVDALISTQSVTKREIIKESIFDIVRLSQVGEIKLKKKIKQRPKFSVATLVDNVEIFVLFDKETINLEAEKERLTKKISDIIEEINQIDHKLKNKDFLNKAPREIVSKEKLRPSRTKSLSG